MFVRKLFCIGGFIDGSLQKEFIEFMVDCQVLKFGDFVTKSGRKTPFFVNTGFYRTGAQLRRLGQYYAEAVNSKFGLDFDVLFGPAYKGIPLSVAATIAISENTVRISVIAQTEKKLRITVTRAFFSAVLSMTVTGLLSSKMLQQQALQLKKLSRLSRLRAM